ncbi:ribonuclease H-like domain-containing protein [Xylariaceae sp. FL0255]|nr:ribonuclease H-like domain-containing protein [Xylariaceae sp. FL0255]
MEDFKSIQERIQASLVSTTRLTSEIVAEDLGFHRTSNPTVAEELDNASERLLELTSSLLKSATKNTDITAPKLEDADDVDVHWARIVDVVDNLLEKADTCLDDYTGLIKRRNTTSDNSSAPAATTSKKSSYALEHSMRRANIVKPQNAFERKPNNLDTSPWKPILTKKPHAVLSLDQSLATFVDESHNMRYKHPYAPEILALEYPEAVFSQHESIPYQPPESTSATFVDTFDGVLEMLEELKNATEIAIDTEHHDFRTYAGLLSLMQISTRDKDWIVDTLQPWRHKLEVLNEVFADPRIIKVLHGAYMDILWLQRDCGLYIVGLFDTYEAACALEYPARSLAYLLKRFTDFNADKKYQLADWRIRPLPEEMFYYARSDTHYLLYVYDNLRNEILSSSPSADEGKAKMRDVLNRSKETSLRRHETYVYDASTGQGPQGWYNMMIKQTAGKFSKEQFAVIRAVHQWRDEVARKEDESPLYVMGNVTLFDIARHLPPDAKALHSILDSGSYLAKREVTTLFDIISRAKEEGANGPSVVEFLRGHSSTGMGVGEIARRIFPDLSHRSKDAVDTKDVVSQSSQLWGDVAMSTRWEPDCKTNVSTTMRFELPWAKFVQSGTVVDDAPPTAGKPESNGISEPKEQETLIQAAPPQDEEFTLRAGLKRKASETDISSDEDNSENGAETQERSDEASRTHEVSADDEIAISSDEEAERRVKKQKKAEKKALKRARKEKLERKQRRKAEKRAKREQDKATSSNQEEDDEESEPFDYSKAKSVLNPERSANSNGDTKGQKAKFNPYGMTAEGPKPARRMHGEKPGRSATFKR